MYELFRHHQSEPGGLNSLSQEAEQEDSEEEDEGVSSVSSPDLCPQLPDLVTGERTHDAVSVSCHISLVVACCRVLAVCHYVTVSDLCQDVRG